MVGMTRIKVLKDEIKKPYFLKLKEFLWDEGVRTSNDTPATVKIFPLREFSICLREGSRSSENLQQKISMPGQTRL